MVYLLHGLTDNYSAWMRYSSVEKHAVKYNVAVVMPEVQRSFYCDTAYGAKYFTYVADELPSICNRWFRLDPKKENTFIVGESMGGYGAVKIGLSRPKRYGAIASLSGVLDYPALCRRIHAGDWGDMLPQELGAIHGSSGMPDEDEDVLELVRQAAADPHRPRLIQMCGTEDFLYGDNQVFRQTAEEANYGHTYLEGPGDHEWPYWDKAIQRAFQFFCGLDLESSPIY